MALTFVYKGKPVIYCHIYRTAGNALRRGLPKGIEVGGGHVAMKDVRAALLSGRLNKVGLSAGFWDKAFRFGFVRNPYDWQVSVYHYILANPTNWAYKEIRDLNYEEYLEWHREAAKRPWKPGQNNLADQYAFLHDDEGQQLVDFVGHVESIQEHYNFVCRILKMPEISIPLFNQNVHRPKRSYQQYTTPRAKALVEEIFHRDFEAYGYTFSGKGAKGGMGPGAYKGIEES